jgi:hypothetical protein
MTEPDSPNETPFEFENRTVPEVAVCVPPASATAEATDCENEAVIVWALRPNEIPFVFKNTTVPVACELVPALMPTP